MRKLKSLSVCLVFLFILNPLNSRAQKIRTEVVWRNTHAQEILEANFYYDENNQLEKVEMELTSFHIGYGQPKEYYTIYRGSLKEFYAFINEVEKFANENTAKTTVFIQNCEVSLLYYEKKTVTLSNDEGKGITRAFTPKKLNRYKTKLVEWADSKGLAYD